MAFKPGIRSKFGFAPEQTTNFFPQNPHFQMKNCQFLIDPEFSGETKEEDDDFDEPDSEPSGER